MASSKEIRSKIKSVKSTRKITRTMEMVATSKMKRALDRVLQAQSYLTKMQEVLGNLQGIKSDNPLLLKRDTVKKSLVFLVTANRGLCGGYNANIIRLGKKIFDRKKVDGLNPELYICGRKGIAFFKFIDQEAFKVNAELTDKPTFAEAEVIAKELMALYVTGRFDEISIVYSHYISAGKQPATTMTLLPLESEKTQRGKSENTDFIFDPDPESILETLIPLSIKNTIYRVLIEAVACEQFARRIAMKNATDAAEEMQKELTTTYNKARQAQITQEISEIVGGAEALK